MICGLPAAGKTTYATNLAARTGAVLFSLDEWLITLFGRYSLPAIGQREHTRRVLACREVIWRTASELLRRSTDVVFDDGFFVREHRERCVRIVRASGGTATIHVMDTPLALVRERLTERNANLPAHNFHIDPDLLLQFLDMFEAPSEAEGANVIVVPWQRR